jgi:hypothetical protein
MIDYVKECREQADNTFYDPLKESWTMVGDHIEKLEAALREIASVSKVIAKNEDMAEALMVLLSSYRKIALDALEGKND